MNQPWPKEKKGFHKSSRHRHPTLLNLLENPDILASSTLVSWCFTRIVILPCFRSTFIRAWHDHGNSTNPFKMTPHDTGDEFLKGALTHEPRATNKKLVSQNRDRDTPKSSIVAYSLINHPFLGTPMTMEPPMTGRISIVCDRGWSPFRRAIPTRVGCPAEDNWWQWQLCPWGWWFVRHWTPLI